MPPDQALRLMRDVAAALGALHRNQKPFLHRDVKPANIIHGDAFVLTDLGIAYCAADPGITQTGACPPFTPGFASPEQLDFWRRHTDLDGRSDLFSLGVVGGPLPAGTPPLPACGAAILSLSRSPDRDAERELATCLVPANAGGTRACAQKTPAPVPTRALPQRG